MSKSFFVYPAFFLLFNAMAFNGSGVSITVKNPTDQSWIEAPVVVPFSPELDSLGSPDILLQGTEILPIQADDLNKDGKPDEIVFLVTLEPGDTKEYIAIKNAYGFYSPNRSHAGLYIKGFEGPGWESDRLGFRLYWDERNAIDLFCKKKPILGLKQYAKPEVNYHQDTPWGMDVLKVGPSLGAGGFGIWLGDKIQKVAEAERNFEVIVDGPIRSIIDLKYTNWIVEKRKFDLTARITITAGQKWADVELFLTPQDDGKVPELVTGVVKHEETSLIQDKKTGILGRWGLQALAPGEVPKGSNLGFGVVVNPSQIVEFGEDASNNYIRLKAEKSPVAKTKGKNTVYARYKIHASWIQEAGGARSTEEYQAMLSSLAKLKPETTVSGK